MKNIFKRKNKKSVNDPLTYLNKKKDHHFMFFTKWNQNKPNVKFKRGLKIASLVIFPLCAIALGTTIGVLSSRNQHQDSSLVNQVIIDDTHVKRRVYLISEDDYTIPLTVSLDKKSNVHEEMLDVINLLKVSSKASNEYLRGFIPDDTRVNSLTNNNGDLIIDFSEEFLSYKEKNEAKMIEALKATMFQFDEVKSVTISVENNILSSLPNNQTPISKIHSSLNNIFYQPSLIENKELVTVFYNRKYDNNHKYLVPVSLYASRGESDNITFVNGLFINLPSSKCLTNLEIYQNINKNQTINDDFSLTVTSSALIDENTVNKDLYDMVLLSLDLMNKETKVSFNIEGETLQVDGVFEEDDQAVNSIYYNETQI